jgi:flagellar L-ring protein FlgH
VKRWMMAVVAVAGLAGPAAADSLWKDSNPGLYADRCARKVGDLLTVLIVESVSGSNDASAALSKENKYNGNGAPGIGLFGLLKAFNTSATSKNEFTGSGKNDVNSKLTARLTVKVTKVEPNGIMSVEGSRMVGVNHDQEELVLTAQVRPEDVKGDNTVLSTYLADANIAYRGHGPNTQSARPGILTRVLNWIF